MSVSNISVSEKFSHVHVQLNCSQNVSLVARNNTDDMNDTAKFCSCTLYNCGL